ncbi:MAG TPA: hypothetical protein VFK05_22190 [Polyangiaceae bacterium]|nr:hypothetical protein [Polyangiaceae bacterium]
MAILGLSGRLWGAWLALLGAAIGSLYGRRQRLDRCGGKECEAPLEAIVRTCPRCLGEVR